MNPFVKQHKLKLIEVYKTIKLAPVSDFNQEVLLNWKTESSVSLMEQQEKTSVYHIGYIENILYEELNTAGRDLLLYIMYRLPRNQDYINLKLDSLCAKMRTSRPTLIKGIQNLVDNAMIIKKAQSEYWVNPYFIFNGDRMSYYKSFGSQYYEVVSKIKHEA